MPSDKTDEVWLVLPSANLDMARKTFPKWTEKGYMIAAVVPDKYVSEYASLVNLLVPESTIGGYKGWPNSVNYLCRQLMEKDIVVAAGDDMYPDANYEAHQLHLQFTRHFGGTLGVMQPYGDKFGSMACDTCEQICGSAWLGKEFRNRVNKGKGPLWEEYWHMYADTELYQVALKHGNLWIRGDLSQYHAHRTREKSSFRPNIPAGNTRLAKQIYDKRKAAGFPESELI
jgi:hypothetical protein